MKTQTVIFDIDGTLANCDHRRHFVTGKKKDFNAFYDAMGADDVNREIKNLCNLYHRTSGLKVIICTGRPEMYRGCTESWLDKYGIHYHELWMRLDSDRFKPDYEIKQVILDDLLKTHEVLITFDDRKQVVDMWRRNGITCLQVDDGDF